MIMFKIQTNTYLMEIVYLVVMTVILNIITKINLSI